MATKQQIREFCFNDGPNWFRSKYESKLSAHNSRYWTFKTALNLFMQRGGKTIVETGCVREPKPGAENQEFDWGGGNSSLIFADFISHYGGSLVSIDNDERHVGICKGLLQKYHPEADASVVLDDSVAGLKKMAEAGQKIDLLYLDSFDFPLFELLDRYGERKDWATTQARLQATPLDKIVAENHDLIDPCQQHCLAEVQAALPGLRDNSAVLIDDNLVCGGKGRLAKTWLLENGWQCVLDDYQALFVRAV